MLLRPQGKRHFALFNLWPNIPIISIIVSTNKIIVVHPKKNYSIKYYTQRYLCVYVDKYSSFDK